MSIPLLLIYNFTKIALLGLTHFFGTVSKSDPQGVDIVYYTFFPPVVRATPSDTGATTNRTSPRSLLIDTPLKPYGVNFLMRNPCS